jgi:transposase
MAKHFLSYDLDQRLLLPPDMKTWLPEGHLALFLADVVGSLDLAPFYRAHVGKDDRGRAAYHPLMMVTLLLYAYCVGKPSSRKIEKATYEDVAFRVLAGDRHPDHDSISTFRKEHIEALGGLFAQVLLLCREAGLVKLGHVAIDGTKMRANASKHKAMSYDRLCEAERKIEEEVARLLAEAERVDAEEDALYGKGKRGDELPAELARRESRLEKIREAKAALEAQAKAAAEAKARMRERLRSEESARLYKMRKAIVEPVFGQVKSVRGLDRFSLRGYAKARGEWLLIAATHNLLKLFRYGKAAPAVSAAAF